MPLEVTGNNLHSAAKAGDVKEVRRLLKLGECNANCVDSFGQAPIHVAALNGHVDTVLCFINEFGCNPNIKGWKDRSLLHNVCQSGEISLVRTLILKHQADINAVDEDKVLPIHVAALKGHTDLVLCLINEFGCDPSKNGGLGRSLLHHACQGGNVDLVQILIREYKADITAVDFEKDPPIHVAAGKGHAEVVLNLINKFGCSPSILGHNNSTLLHRACHGGNVSLVRTLIKEHKADMNAVDVENEAPIHVAAWSGQADVVTSLIKEFGYDPNVRGRNKRSLLHEACQSGNSTLVRALVSKHHVDINATDDKNRSPLYIAIASDHLEIALCLIKEFNCDCKVTDIDGNVSRAQSLVRLIELQLTASNDCACSIPPNMTGPAHAHVELCTINKIWDDDGIARAKLGRYLLHNACKSNNVELVKTLIFDQPISPILLTDDMGDTALHISSRLNHSECVKALLDANAPILMRNGSGLTPLDVATGETKEVLQQYMKANHVELQKKYDSYFEHAKKRYPGKYSITRVFVLGNIRAGKSTLIESMKRCFIDSYEQVTEEVVPLNTAGIIPTVYMDQQYGRLSFYDFAGDSEYYSSHAAIFERLASLNFGHDLFIIVVDLTKENSEIESTLYYWVSFIQHQKFTGERLSLVVIGSHVDLVDKSELVHKHDHLKLLSEEFKSDLATHQVACFVLDCCNPREFGDFKDQILCWKALSPMYPLNADLSLLVGLLEKDFSEVTACSMQTIQSHIKANGFNCLPSETRRFFPIIYTLHVAGFLLILNITDGCSAEEVDHYIVLNCSKLTNEVHQSLFSETKLRHKCSNQIQAFNVGVIPDTIIKDILPAGITEECLVQLQFCQRISYKDVDAFPSLTASPSSEQNFLFFPALCRAEKHSTSVPLHPDFKYSIGWLALCSDPRDYFPPRFLHVLLLNLVFDFTLSVPVEIYPRNAPKEQRNFQRRCTMWKTGVCWLMTQGVECTVELVHGNKGVVVISRSRLAGSETCATIFDKVVHCVMDVKSKFCHSVKPSFFFLDSVNEANYLSPNHQFAMSDVDRALMCPEENDFIISVSGQSKIERSKFLWIHRFTHWHRIFPIDSISVLKYLKEVVDELPELGIHLGLPHRAIKAIEKDFSSDTSIQQYEVVRAWLNSSSLEPPCWLKLVQALETIDYKYLSAQIQENYDIHIQLQSTLLEKSNCASKPDEAFLEAFARVLGSTWSSLAISLTLSESEVKKIKKELHHLSIEEQALYMLKQWASTDHATYGDLFHQLRTISLFTYATSIVNNSQSLKRSPCQQVSARISPGQSQISDGSSGDQNSEKSKLPFSKGTITQQRSDDTAASSTPPPSGSPLPLSDSIPLNTLSTKHNNITCQPISANMTVANQFSNSSGQSLRKHSLQDGYEPPTKIKKEM